MLIIAVAQFFSALTGPVGNILQMTGRQKVYQNMAIAFTIGHVGLNILLVPRFGINGAAIAGFITIVSRNAFSVWYIKKSYGFLRLYIPLLIK